MAYKWEFAFGREHHFTLNMLRSFLTITFRVLWRNKVTSFVNIFSLSIGITAFILIMLYVHHETSYDKFNENYDRIYRLEGDDYGKLPPVAGMYIKDRVPEVKNIARLIGGWKDFISYLPDDDPEKLKHIEAIYFWADSTTFDVFTLPFIQGNPRTALKEPFTVVLTASTAEKLFGDRSPMMKSIEFEGNEFRVTGIIKDVKYSHIEIDALFSQESIPKIYSLKDTGWNPSLWSATYLLMTADADKDLVEKKINDVLTEINDGILFDIEFEYFKIRPLRDIYFRGSVQNLQYGLHGNLKLTLALSAIGVFLLVLACINYINLTTARSAMRAKEVAIKRVAGSSLGLLRYQLLIESVLVSIIALVLAMTIVQIFLPIFNLMTRTDIAANDLNSPVVWGGIVSGAVLLGILAGIYPAIYFTAATPLGLMKGERIKGSGRSFRISRDHSLPGPIRSIFFYGFPPYEGNRCAQIVGGLSKDDLFHVILGFSEMDFLSGGHCKSCCLLPDQPVAGGVCLSRQDRCGYFHHCGRAGNRHRTDDRDLAIAKSCICKSGEGAQIRIVFSSRSLETGNR